MASAALQLYEAIGAASRRMLEAARGEDWDGLLAAEEACAALIARARAGATESLRQAELARKNEILGRVLAEDAEIRARLDPWMAHLESLLAVAERSTRARQRYGEGQGA